MAKAKVNYALVESILTEHGLTFHKPTPGHYTFPQSSVKLVYYPKSHTISVRDEMKQLKVKGFSRSAEAYSSDAEEIKTLIATSQQESL